MSKSDPRPMTIEEMRAKFLDQIRTMVQYWDKVQGQSQRERLEGLAFSFLTLLDGGSGLMPAFDLIPSPHPTDKEFHHSEGTNWWAKEVINDCQLHELFFKKS